MNTWTSSDIAGLKFFRLGKFSDERGIIRFINDTPKKVKQINHVTSNYGVFRGMHFQKTPYEQGKLVYVAHGEIIDYVSTMEGDTENIVSMHMTKGDALWVPKGCAHGFYSLSLSNVIYCMTNSPYIEEAQSGFKPEFIDDSRYYVISEKDKNLPTYKEMKDAAIG